MKTPAGSKSLQAAAPTTCVHRNAFIRAAASTPTSRRGVIAPVFKDQSAPELLNRECCEQTPTGRCSRAFLLQAVLSIDSTVPAGVQEAVQSGLQKAAAVGLAASLLLSSPAAAEDAPGGRTLLRSEHCSLHLISAAVQLLTQHYSPFYVECVGSKLCHILQAASNV
jgi:hypothetical protein